MRRSARWPQSDASGALAATLGQVPDIERITTRIALLSARPRDLASLRDGLKQLPALRRSVQQCFIAGEASLLAAVHDALATPDACLDLLQRAVAEEPAAMVRDGGVFARGFDAELDELRGLSENAGQFLVDLETRERARTGIANLRVEYNKVHGFYIEVTHGQTDKVPDDYRRRQTLKNAERYITPELKVFEDKALSAQDKALVREKLLYDQLLADLAPHIATLQTISQGLAQLDTLTALTTHALQHNWCAPQLVAEPCLDIREGRHPVVENQIERFIANDCCFTDERRLLLITGPNMGGKSTFMRQVALITLLAYIGSYVPAASATIGPIDRIFTRIGATDDLAGGRSTFMVEMTESAAILNGATEHSLVLMDEVGRGTSTFDGLALAWAIARHLIDTSRSFTLFATHYFELTQLPESHPSAANVHLSAVEHKDSIVFLHAVQAGPASQSYGLQVAQLAGVPQGVIKAARKHLARLESQALDTTPQLDLFALPCVEPDDEAPAAPQARQRTAGGAGGDRSGRAHPARGARPAVPAEAIVRVMARPIQLAAACLAALAVHGALLAAPKKDPDRHQFGVIGHSFHNGGGEAKLKQAIADESESALAFVVVTGIKGDERTVQRQAVRKAARDVRRRAPADDRGAGRQRLERLQEFGRPFGGDRAPEPPARAVLQRADLARRAQAAADALVGQPELSQLRRERALGSGRRAVRDRQPPGQQQPLSSRGGPQQRVRGPAGGQPVLAEPPVRHGQAREARCDRAVFGGRREGADAADRLARLAGPRPTASRMASTSRAGRSPRWRRSFRARCC